MYKVSVVTICRNEIDNIAKTIQSVTSQKYSDFEYIIKDGCSTDGTLEKAQELATRTSQIEMRVISQQDSGIYSAMNQAIDLSNGEWILFMNAGDEFFNTEVLADVFAHNLDGVDVIYGHTCCVLRDGSKFIQVNNHDNLAKEIGISQQVCLVRRELLEKYKFDESYKILADFKMLYQLYNTGHVFRSLNMVIAKYYRGGVSTVNALTIRKEFNRIFDRNENDGRFKAFLKGLFEKYFPHLSDKLFVAHICKGIDG